MPTNPIEIVDECLGLVREHRFIAMEARMRQLEAKLTILRNTLNTVRVSDTSDIVDPALSTAQPSAT